MDKERKTMGRWPTSGSGRRAFFEGVRLKKELDEILQRGQERQAEQGADRLLVTPSELQRIHELQEKLGHPKLEEEAYTLIPPTPDGCRSDSDEGRGGSGCS